MNRKLLNLLRANARKGQFKVEQTADGGNVIMIYDVIVAADADADWFGGVSAESFVPLLAGLEGDVDIRVNSPGGDVFGAKAMAQAIRDYPGQVTVHVDGLAASAATFLTSVADRTIMAPGSLLMIHKAWTIDIGNADDFRATANLLEKIDGTIADTYAAAAKRRDVAEPADFVELMASETWLTAAEAIELGLADEQAEDKPKAQLKWDLSAYEHAPKGDDGRDPALAERRAEIDELKAKLSPPKTEETSEIEPPRPHESALLLRPAA